MTTAVAPAPTAVTVTPSGRWRGVLGLMNAWSADARMLEAPQGSEPVRARPLPLPLLVQPELAPGHDGGKLGVGVIDRIWTEQGFVMGEGRFDMDDPAGAELARKVGLGFIRFVSLDVDDATAQQVCLSPDGQTINEDCDPGDPTAEMGMVYSGWRVMGATLLAHPAFPDAHIALADESTDTIAQSAQAAVSLAAGDPVVPGEGDAEIVGYDPAWGCVLPDAEGASWLPTDCETPGAVQANATGDGPFDPEQVAAATGPAVPEEMVEDEGTGCVAPTPEGGWVAAGCDDPGAVPANAEGTGPAEEVTDAANESDTELAVRLAEGDTTPTHAGVAIKALDTGRILLLQRSLDPEDPAAGLWEFPGGSIDEGEDPQAAAWREFTEETGVTLPESVTVVDGWRSDNGIYQGFIATVPTEAEVGINPDTADRTLPNPDDPDGDAPEVTAWWDLGAIPDMPALRPEVAQTPWDLLAAAGTDPVEAPADVPAEAAAATYAIPFPDIPGEDSTDDSDTTDDSPEGKDKGNGCVCEQEDGSWAPCDCTTDDAVTADENGQPVAEADDELEMAAMPADCKPCQGVAITASASTDTAAAPGFKPLAEWFNKPTFDGPQPITVDPDTGRLSGHLAAWGTCHVGFQDRCITPPRSHTGYGFFHTARIPTSNGSLDVGIITMDTGHAQIEMTASGAVAHYDNTGTQAAVARVGEDQWGIWVAGVTLPFVTQEQRLRLSLAAFSGDWRHIRGGAELVAALAVNTPGFPMPARKTGADNAEYALVAAGALPARRAPAKPKPLARVTVNTGGVDAGEVARIVLGELDARDNRKARFSRLSAAFTELGNTARQARIALAASKIADLADDIPKGIRATKSDLELASRADFANWVEQQGGLPRKIKRVAEKLKAKGMGESQSIATAVNVARKACASGDTNWPGKQQINPKSKAEYCAAIARWEQMKAAANAG